MNVGGGYGEGIGKYAMSRPMVCHITDSHVAGQMAV
jgi:hypothetical protein